MCGRYAWSADADTLVDEFGIDDVDEDLPGASWNVAPTDEVPVVLERMRDDRPVRRLRPLHWGLVPSWAKDTSIGSRMINARLESVAEKPAFRKAFASRRCLLPADGFYEWYDTGRTTAKGKPVKQPYFIRGGPLGGDRPLDGPSLLAMAGLYEYWRAPGNGDWFLSCTVITTDAVDDVGRLHDRMPVVVGPDAWDQWLDPQRTDADDVLELLQHGAPLRWHAHPVSTEVNAVRNNGAHLVDPVEPVDTGAEDNNEEPGTGGALW